MKTDEAMQAQLDEAELLSADDILAADDLATKDLLVPEWGKDGKPRKVRIKLLSAAEAVKVNDIMKNEAMRKEFALHLVRMSVVGADGQPLFTPAQLEALRKKAFKPFMTLRDEILKFNGLVEEKKDEPKKVEEALKND